jgi:Rad3-related DNA helicase
VTVDFPYKPYPCQIAMLGRIIKALQQSKHCLLESPTGTGKTLTLLCAALAWQQKEIEQSRMSSYNDNQDNSIESSKPTPISRIFYCTRTHKQLEQVAKQLNNTVYKDKIRMTLLSSRDNYCVHPVVSKGPNKNHECVKITRPDQHKLGQRGFKSECGYYERLKGKIANDFLRSSGSKQLPRVFDIETFTEYCQSNHAVCPYYTSRLLINDVQIILCPYNYLIDPRVRNSMQMSINNSVIIIDEGKNNLFDLIRDEFSFFFST